MCPFCGEPEVLELFEVWGRDFMVETCCEATQDLFLESIEEVPREGWKEICARSGVTVRGVWPDSTFHLKLDFGLEFCAVTLAQAKAFVLEHHRHNAPPIGWRWGHGLMNGRDLVAVCMVGRPVARGFDPSKVVEVNRLCVRPTDPPKLTWNACSMLYGAAAREAKRRGFERIVTYIREDEDGTTLKAAGWTRTARVRGRRWGCKSRPRGDKDQVIDKWRYERSLR